MTNAPEHPKLFISYAWTSEKHKKWVLELATKLRDSGVDAFLDEWELKIGHDMIKFMEGMITDPAINKVIMVVDKNYAEKADARKGGVGVETRIIADKINDDEKQEKFAAIALEKDDKGNLILPVYCKSRVCIDFSEHTNPENYHKSFSNLWMWACGKTLNEKPPLGQLCDFSPIKSIDDEHSMAFLTSANMFLKRQILWTERDICRAAVSTYFSLEEMPVNSKDNGDFMGFKSAAGYIYTCRIKNNIAILQWVNATGDTMNSKATSFKQDGNTLIVTDNTLGATRIFTKG